ncbi:hypothetical protein [Pseudooceanicola nanhaiensis]|uniref:hypothetical protein n=1 Tax=Pseudooceanicola nanhaiensis TaxID=375761 RepID=UPI00351737AB
MSAPSLARWTWVDGKGGAGGLRLTDVPSATRPGVRATQDATTIAAREIVDEETSRRNQLTAELRAARLAREAEGAK